MSPHRALLRCGHFGARNGCSSRTPTSLEGRELRLGVRVPRRPAPCHLPRYAVYADGLKAPGRLWGWQNDPVRALAPGDACVQLPALRSLPVLQNHNAMRPMFRFLVCDGYGSTNLLHGNSFNGDTRVP